MRGKLQVANLPGSESRRRHGDTHTSLAIYKRALVRWAGCAIHVTMRWEFQLISLPGRIAWKSWQQACGIQWMILRTSQY